MYRRIQELRDVQEVGRDDRGEERLVLQGAREGGRARRTGLRPRPPRLHRVHLLQEFERLPGIERARKAQAGRRGRGRENGGDWAIAAVARSVRSP